MSWTICDYFHVRGRPSNHSYSVSIGRIVKHLFIHQCHSKTIIPNIHTCKPQIQRLLSNYLLPTCLGSVPLFSFLYSLSVNRCKLKTELLQLNYSHVYYTNPTIIFCDPPQGNQAQRVEKNFWVKATITNYNHWTIAPANLKSLAGVVMEIWAKYTRITRTRLLRKIAMNIAMYVARESLYTVFIGIIAAATINFIQPCWSAATNRGWLLLIWSKVTLTQQTRVRNNFFV